MLHLAGKSANLSNIQVDMLIFILCGLGPMTLISELRVQTKGPLTLTLKLVCTYLYHLSTAEFGIDCAITWCSQQYRSSLTGWPNLGDKGWRMQLRELATWTLKGNWDHILLSLCYCQSCRLFCNVDLPKAGECAGRLWQHWDCGARPGVGRTFQEGS